MLPIKKIINYTLHSYDQVPSTQTTAMSLASNILNIAHGLVVTAKEQSNGYGQRDSSWVSPKGNIYMTLVLELQENMDIDFSICKNLSIISAISVGDAITNLDYSNKSKIGFKWVNDIMLHDMKCGGIIVQLIKGLVFVGIGLNVSSCPSQDQLHRIDLSGKQYEATALENHISHVNKSELEKDIIESLITNVNSAITYGAQIFYQKWNERCIHMNKTISANVVSRETNLLTSIGFVPRETNLVGTFHGLSETGKVILEIPHIGFMTFDDCRIT